MNTLAAVLLLTWLVLVFAMAARLWWLTRHDELQLDPEFQTTQPQPQPPREPGE